MDALDHQKNALEEITRRARAYFAGDWRGLPILPRWASLMVGPTGTGKTAVAAIAAEAIGASMLRVSAPSWMPAGAHNRGTRETITIIGEHVARNARTLLVTDETCKLLTTIDDTGWQGYIRAEYFEILDGRWPTGLKEIEDESGNEVHIDCLTQKLRDTVFILGIGTFQSWFDDSKSRQSIGFGATDPAADEISADIIAERIPRELANRFNQNLILIPELKPSDYHRIAKEAEQKLPEHMHTPFRVEVAKRIPSAISAKKGVRFLEEAMMEVLKNLPPKPHQKNPEPTP